MDPSKKEAVSRFEKAFLAFDMDAVPALAQDMLHAEVGIREFLGICMPLMEIVGEKYESGEYYLPQLVVAGEMFKSAGTVFKSRVKSGQSLPEVETETIVLGTPRGDIHSLGKDIFAVLAEANGFAVHDLGVDVPPEKFVETVKKTRASIVGMSSLLTTTFDSMLDVVTMLEKDGLREGVFVIIGGGATEKSLVEKFRVDAQTRDAYEGIKLIRKMIQSRKEQMPCRKHA